MKPHIPLHDYLAVNACESGGVFRQECGLKVTIAEKMRA